MDDISIEEQIKGFSNIQLCVFGMQIGIIMLDSSKGLMDTDEFSPTYNILFQLFHIANEESERRGIVIDSTGEEIPDIQA